jgi:hypothetical protein
MREHRAVAFPLAWVLGGAAAGLATFELWLGALVFIACLVVVLGPELLAHRTRQRRLAAMGIRGRLPAGLAPMEALTPAVSLLVAIASAIGIARIATADISDSLPEQGRLVLLTFLCILGGACLGIMAIFLLVQRRGLERLARSRGWNILGADVELAPLLYDVEPVRFGQPPHPQAAASTLGRDRYQHTCEKVLVGRMGKVPFRIFEYHYTWWTPDPRHEGKSTRQRRTHHVLAASMPAVAPDLVVRALDARLGTRDGPPDVAIAQGQFAATFSVQCHEAEFVYEWLNQGVVDVLMALGPEYALNWNHGNLTLYGPGPLDTVAAMQFYGGLQQMVRMMPFADNPPRIFAVPGQPGPSPRRAFEPSGPTFNVQTGPRKDR